jgi:hypothetical protein
MGCCDGGAPLLRPSDRLGHFRNKPRLQLIVWRRGFAFVWKDLEANAGG